MSTGHQGLGRKRCREGRDRFFLLWHLELPQAQGRGCWVSHHKCCQDFHFYPFGSNLLHCFHISEGSLITNILILITYQYIFCFCFFQAKQCSFLSFGVKEWQRQRKVSDHTFCLWMIFSSTEQWEIAIAVLFTFILFLKIKKIYIMCFSNSLFCDFWYEQNLWRFLRSNKLNSLQCELLIHNPWSTVPFLSVPIFIEILLQLS